MSDPNLTYDELNAWNTRLIQRVIELEAENTKLRARLNKVHELVHLTSNCIDEEF